MAANPFKILAFGDSLSAGYMLSAQDAFPAQLERALRADGYEVTVINGGVSGDTSSGGKARLDWALADKPQFAIVELGANDALRGVDPKLTEANLDDILTRLKAQGVRPLLAGMLAPRNMGADYVKSFDGLYPRLRDKHGVPLYPFFLDGVATHPDLTLSDGLHPTVQGVGVVVKGILPLVEKWLGPPAGKAKS